MPAKLPALIFDFGNVVAFFDYTRIGASLGRHMGLSGEEFLIQARSLGFTSLLQRYESGKISCEDFGQAICSLVNLRMTHEEFAAIWADIFWLNEPVAKLVGELRERGYTLVLGSNTNKMHADHYQQQFAGELSAFKKLVLSHEVGHIKPSRDFYLACAAAAGADPADCLFIDDLSENVEGAKSAGLRAFLFTDEPTLRRDLQSVGIGWSM